MSLPGLASNCDTPELWLLSSEDCRYEPVVLLVLHLVPSVCMWYSFLFLCLVF
jgi:hypothetical protein